MADNSSERKKDSGVFVKQPLTDYEVIGLSYNPSKSPKKKEKRRRTRSSSSSSSSSSRSKSHRKRRSRRKYHKNKKRRRHYTSSSSSDSSTSSRSPSPTPVNTSSSRRFQITTEEEKFQYSIPGDMAECVNENFDRFLSEKDLKENILKENPVPRNINPVKLLDHSPAKVVEGRQETLADKDLETVQLKIRDVLDPICRLWAIIEKAATQENSEEKEDQVSLEDIIILIEKSVMLLGQANNKVAYFRRLNILNVSLNSKSDAKGILYNYGPLLSTNSSELFGRQFRKQVLDNTKAQKETLKMLREVDKTKKKPFSASFPGRNKQSPRGSAGNHNRISFRQHFRTQQQQRLQRNTTTFCNISVELVPLEELEHVHPLVKEMFPEELKQNVPLGGASSHFVQSWEKLTKDQEILEIVKGYKIPLLRPPVQEKIPLNTLLKKIRNF